MTLGLLYIFTKKKQLLALSATASPFPDYCVFLLGMNNDDGSFTFSSERILPFF